MEAPSRSPPSDRARSWLHRDLGSCRPGPGPSPVPQNPPAAGRQLPVSVRFPHVAFFPCVHCAYCVERHFAYPRETYAGRARAQVGRLSWGVADSQSACWLQRDRHHSATPTRVNFNRAVVPPPRAPGHAHPADAVRRRGRRRATGGQVAGAVTLGVGRRPGRSPGQGHAAARLPRKLNRGREPDPLTPTAGTLATAPSTTLPRTADVQAPDRRSAPARWRR